MQTLCNPGCGARVADPRGRKHFQEQTELYMLLPEHNFSYEHIRSHPREMPTWKIDDLEYEVRHANGFIKLYTIKGITYWATQATYENKLPDWKLHFSILQDDLNIAWNIIAHLFIKRRIQFGMKVAISGEDWPESMRGREVTVYIYRYCDVFARETDPGLLLTKSDEKPTSFWRRFVKDAELELRRHNVRSRGCADGDLPLGRYASVRNEAFVRYDPAVMPQLPPGWQGFDVGALELGKVQIIYPPNFMGYNAAHHQNPLENGQSCLCSAA